MWMQQSMEGGNRGGGFGSYSSNNYQGNSSRQSSTDEDWRSRLISNGQWLGEKVMALATGGSHSSIPDNQRHVNDGRANWMAEIRNNTGSSSFSNASSYNYNAGVGSGYQNDFVTERPTQYTDTSNRPTSYSDNNYATKNSYSSNSFNNSSSSSSYAAKKASSKKKGNNKKHKKKSKDSDDDDSDSSESEESESEASSSDSDVKPVKKGKKKAVIKPEILPSSDESEEDVKTSKKSKTKAKAKSKKALGKRATLSEDDAATESAPEDMSKKSKARAKSKDANYSFSFDPSKIPAAPEDSKKDKKATKKSSKGDKKKTAEVAQPPPVVVDLLGVDSLSISSGDPFPRAAAAPAISAIDELAGISFDPLANVTAAPVQQHPIANNVQGGMHFQQYQMPINQQMRSQFHPTSQHQPAHFHAQQQAHQSVQRQHSHPTTRTTTGFELPGSNLVDLRTESEVSAAKTHSDTRSLNDIKASTSGPSQPVMQSNPMMHPSQMGMAPQQQYPSMHANMQPNMHMTMPQNAQMMHMAASNPMYFNQGGGYGQPYPNNGAGAAAGNTQQSQHHGYM